MDITPGGEQAGLERFTEGLPGCTGIAAYGNTPRSQVPQCPADGKDEFRCEILSCNTPDAV